MSPPAHRARTFEDQTMLVSRSLLAALALALLSTTPSQAMEDKMYPSATKPWRKQTGDVPPCGLPKVLDRIAWHFYERESRFWESPVQISGFQNLQEIAFAPWGLEYVPRRFCKGAVWTSDGKQREIFFSIGENMGEASIGWGVEWCITGLDRNLAYAPLCKMAQP
jgi:hypothetical protein